MQQDDLKSRKASHLILLDETRSSPSASMYTGIQYLYNDSYTSSNGSFSGKTLSTFRWLWQLKGYRDLSHLTRWLQILFLATLLYMYVPKGAHATKFSRLHYAFHVFIRSTNNNHVFYQTHTRNSLIPLQGFFSSIWSI